MEGLEKGMDGEGVWKGGMEGGEVVDGRGGWKGWMKGWMEGVDGRGWRMGDGEKCGR